MKDSFLNPRRLERASMILLIGLFIPGSGSLAQSRRGSFAAPGLSHAGHRILDPATGAAWMLMPTPACPGCPGKLFPIASSDETSDRVVAQSALHPPVIRAGDPLVLEETSGPVQGTLTAIASQPARAGELLKVRLTFNGSQVCVIALGPGRARLTPATEWQR